MPRSTGAPDRHAYRLEALRDFTSGLARARNFDESLRVALMGILGTFSVAKGILFLEDEGEFCARVSRGLPPGVPPVEISRALLAALRPGRLPVSVRNGRTPAAVRAVVAQVEDAAPVFEAATFCPLGSRKGLVGFVLLGPTLSGGGISGVQRETLGVMTAFLARHVSDYGIVQEVQRLNRVLRHKAQENSALLEAMHEIYLDTIRALAAAIEAKDPYTRGHSERVARISVSIAQMLGLPEDQVQAIHIASILHDVGKIGTDRAILAKAGALSRKEYRELQRHPLTSYDILSEIRFPYPDVPRLARHHHERMDGSGYPDGKRDREIPLGARIIALADAFDAMVSDRPYRDGRHPVHALAEIRDCVDRHFDAQVAKAFFVLVQRELSGGAPGDLPILPADRRGNPAHSRARLVEFLDKTISAL